MLETLTIKFPSSLMKNIKSQSHKRKISRGAFVREALMHYMSCASDDPDNFDFMKATRELLKGTKKKKTSVIDELRKVLARQPQPDISPEEEIRLSRTRGLL